MADTNQTPPNDDIVKELGRLGDNLGKFIRNIWDSEERKSVEREIRAGMDQMSKQVNQAVESAKTDENVKKAGDQVKQAMETVRVPEILDEVRKGITEGLRRLNEEVERMATAKPAEEVKPDNNAEAAAPTDSANPPTE